MFPLCSSAKWLSDSIHLLFQTLFGKEADKLEHANDDERTYYIIEKDALVSKPQWTGLYFSSKSLCHYVFQYDVYDLGGGRISTLGHCFGRVGFVKLSFTDKFT